MVSAPEQARALAGIPTTCGSLQQLELFGSVCIAACQEMCGFGRIPCSQVCVCCSKSTEALAPGNSHTWK